MSWIDQHPDMAGAFAAVAEAKSVEQKIFREAMSRLGAAVHVITTDGSSGKTGFLTVMCKPVACDHVIDGARDLGGSPLFKQELTSGKHVLTVRVDSTHAQKIVTVDVPEGENVTIRPDGGRLALNYTVPVPD